MSLTSCVLLFITPLLAEVNTIYTPDALPQAQPYRNPGSKLTPAFTDANSMAMHFINLVDNQAYGSAWADSSRLMKDVVPREIWVEGVRSLRRSLGVVRARSVTSHYSSQSLPGGTRGNFMIINYSTEFAGQPSTVETVTMMMESALGIWRVLSYHLGVQ